SSGNCHTRWKSSLRGRTRPTSEPWPTFWPRRTRILYRAAREGERGPPFRRPERSVALAARPLHGLQVGVLLEQAARLLEEAERLGARARQLLQPEVGRLPAREDERGGAYQVEGGGAHVLVRQHRAALRVGELVLEARSVQPHLFGHREDGGQVERAVVAVHGPLQRQA